MKIIVIEETPPNFLLLSAARNDTDVWLLVIIIGFLALVFFLTGTGAQAVSYTPLS